MASSATSPWSSQQSGWHSEAKPPADPFSPTRDSLLFAQLLNSSVDHDGFITAFFSPDIAVDSMGRVLRVPQERFHVIVQLAIQTLDLPDTGSFRNTWRLKHEKSDRDIRRLLVRADGRETLKETSVYGYEKEREVLEKEVQGWATLPGVLRELFGLLEEAREHYGRGDEDSSLIQTIKALISQE